MEESWKSRKPQAQDYGGLLWSTIKANSTCKEALRELNLKGSIPCAQQGKPVLVALHRASQEHSTHRLRRLVLRRAQSQNLPQRVYAFLKHDVTADVRDLTILSSKQHGQVKVARQDNKVALDAVVGKNREKSGAHHDLASHRTTVLFSTPE